jgi:hypothetical protein
LTADSNRSGSNITLIGAGADVAQTNLSFATAIGAGALVTGSNTIALGRPDGSDLVRVYGKLRITLPPATTSLCFDSSFVVGRCSSSLRYKTDVQSFTGGLEVVRRLSPITFTWRDGGARDVGFGAEDVEKLDPLLVTYNENGEIEGVKYGQLTTVLVNAVKEQQDMIVKLRQQLDALRACLKRVLERSRYCQSPFKVRRGTPLLLAPVSMKPAR